jgi:phage tail-like protein
MTTNVSPLTPSSYVEYLPAVLQDDAFLGRFLLAFEAILSGVSVEGVSTPTGFEATLANIHDYFSPARTPKESQQDFLPWLASWVALSLRDDWDEQVKRDFIQQIVPLYQKRGTKAALETLLKIYLQKQVSGSLQEYVKVIEFDHIPHYFQVQLRIDSQDLTEYRRKQTVARAIIDLEKPAHTVYALQILMPTMRLVSADKLKVEGVKEGDIPLRRLRLFATSQNSDFQLHQNRTVLGTTAQRPDDAGVNAQDTDPAAAASSSESSDQSQSTSPGEV